MGDHNSNWFGFRRRWLWFGIPLLLLGSLVIYLIVPGAIAPPAPNAVEVAVSDPSGNGPATRLVVRQHCPGSVVLMNWILEQKAGPGWKRVAGETFQSGKVIDRDQGYSFTVTPPAEGSGYRVRVQYGIGLHGLQLWRARARVARRARRLAALLSYNEFEMGESIADLVR